MLTNSGLAGKKTGQLSGVFYKPVLADCSLTLYIRYTIGVFNAQTCLRYWFTLSNGEGGYKEEGEGRQGVGRWAMCGRFLILLLFAGQKCNTIYTIFCSLENDQHGAS